MRKYVKLDNAKINFNNFVQDARLQGAVTGAGHVKCEIVLQTAIIKKQLINPMRWQQVAQMPIHNYGAAVAAAAAMAKRFAGRMNYVVNAAHTKRTLHEQGQPGRLANWLTGCLSWPSPSSSPDAVVISMVNENTASCKLQVASCSDAAATALLLQLLVKLRINFKINAWQAAGVGGRERRTRAQERVPDRDTSI